MMRCLIKRLFSIIEATELFKTWAGPSACPSKGLTSRSSLLLIHQRSKLYEIYQGISEDCKLHGGPFKYFFSFEGFVEDLTEFFSCILSSRKKSTFETFLEHLNYSCITN